MVGERMLLDDGEMWIERGEHVCLIGPNGSGKSTLVEALVGRRELDAGRVQIGHNVELGYLSQHAELPRDDSLTALAHAQARRPGSRRRRPGPSWDGSCSPATTR